MPKNVIKEISGKLYPFHDTLLEEFKFEKKNIYKEKLENLFSFVKTKDILPIVNVIINWYH